MADSTSEDFLYASPVEHPGSAEPADAAPRRHIPTVVLTAGWLAVGLVAGVVSVALLHAGRTTAAPGLPPAALAGNPQQAAPGGLAGPGFGGPGFGGPGFGGGRDGEQHVVGTLVAVGSSNFTLRTFSGTTTTYQIDASTELVKDGRQVSSLSVMHTGDNVLVHVYPSNGATRVERVIDAPTSDVG